MILLQKAHVEGKPVVTNTLLKKMKNIATNRRLIALLMALMLPLLIPAACKKSSDKNPDFKKQSQEEEDSQKAPKQLTEIEESIEKIIMNLDGPAAAKKEGDNQQGGEKGGQSEENKTKEESTGGEKKSGEESTGSKSSQQDGTGKQEQQSGKSTGSTGQKPEQTEQKDPWQKITPIVNKLHYTWNAFMPMAAKQGADKALIDKFSIALNSLTDTIIGKNKTNTLLAASFLYANIPDFYSLYRTGTSSEIKRIRYYTRNAMLNSMTANWEQADSDLNNLKSSWSLYKTTISKDQQEDSNRLEFSIYELEKVVKSKNQSLTDIKGRVAMSNIDVLEEAIGKSGKNE